MPENDMSQKHRPHLVILATGGTIAGSAPSPTQTTGYTAGVIGIEALLHAIPQADGIARLTGEHIAGIDSKDMTEALWLRLSRRISEVASDSTVDGIVITHGTDTLEETAYFLHLTANCRKPIVLTGAMRPATAISADGPANLWQALLTAAHPEAAGKGVLVVLNSQIDGARDITKFHANSLAAFLSPRTGPLGFFAGDELHWNGMPSEKHTCTSEFAGMLPAALPPVKIIYGCAGDDGLFIEAAAQAGVKGLVYAGFGTGSIPEAAEAVLRKALRAGISVVVCSRCPAGAAVLFEDKEKTSPFLCGGTLTPQKARILLQLALTRTEEHSELQRIFRQY